MPPTVFCATDRIVIPQPSTVAARRRRPRSHVAPRSLRARKIFVQSSSPSKKMCRTGDPSRCRSVPSVLVRASTLSCKCRLEEILRGTLVPYRSSGSGPAARPVAHSATSTSPSRVYVDNNY
ncbi:hypothetical protein QTP88_012911 [Uroleucon formosanum]